MGASVGRGPGNDLLMFIESHRYKFISSTAMLVQSTDLAYTADCGHVRQASLYASLS